MRFYLVFMEKDCEVQVKEFFTEIEREQYLNKLLETHPDMKYAMTEMDKF